MRNVASRRTAVAAGYRYEGVLRRAMTVADERVDDVLLLARCPATRGRGTPARRAAAAAGLGWPRLTDGRLIVRPFEPDDAPAVRAACDDPDVAHWIHGLPAPTGSPTPSGSSPMRATGCCSASAPGWR